LEGFSSKVWMKRDGRDCVARRNSQNCGLPNWAAADFLLFPPSSAQMKPTKGQLQRDIVQITLISGLIFLTIFFASDYVRLPLCASAGTIRFRTLGSIGSHIIFQGTRLRTHLPICNPLVLDPAGEPFKRSGARIEFILWRLLNCSRDHGALVRQRTKHDRVAWSSKKHKGPSFVVGLGARWRTGGGIRQSRKIILTWKHNAYTTLWVLDLKIPPLNTAIASPRLQMAWPSIGYIVFTIRICLFRWPLR
jgi:hypothetical protein